MRLLPSALLATSVAASTLLAGAGAASAKGDAYQYWSYFQVKDGAFSYAATGAGEAVPADGTVEGWRWAASTGAMITPRADLSELTFDAVCGEDEAASGEKRVAVVVDFGPDSDALGSDSTPEPYAACAVVPTKATGLQALEAVADVRTETGSVGVTVCGIDGYPSTTCANGTTDKASEQGEVVDIAVKGDDAEAEPAAAEDNGNTSLLVGGGVLVGLLVLLGGVIALRRKSA